MRTAGARATSPVRRPAARRSRARWDANGANTSHRTHRARIRAVRVSSWSAASRPAPDA